MPNYHPDVRLRLNDVHLTFGWDLSVRVATASDLVGLDGQAFDQSGYTHRIAPADWPTITLADAVRAAHVAHHAALGLDPPQDMPLHLHPRGDPEQTPQPVTDGDPPTYEEHLTRLIAHVTAVKQDELNAGRAAGTPAIALDVRAHPASPHPTVAVVGTPPAPVIDIVPPLAPRRPLQITQEG